MQLKVLQFKEDNSVIKTVTPKSLNYKVINEDHHYGAWQTPMAQNQLLHITIFVVLGEQSLPDGNYSSESMTTTST